MTFYDRRHLVGSLFLSAFIVAASLTAAMADTLLDTIKTRGSLKVGLEGTYPPFSYQDESGKLVGFEVDFANALAAKLGVKADFQLTNWNGLLAALESKRVDVVINQVSVNEERKKKYDFSEPYTISGIQIIVRKGTEDKINKPADLAGKRVAAGIATNYGKWLRENVPTAVDVSYDDNATPYQDLRTGRIDAVLNDRLVAADIIKKTGNIFVASGKPFATEGSAIALRKDPELQAALNQAIDALRADGQLAAISDKWFGTDVTK